eukprot:6654842-Alexandrium_andersonii.AAC.1
MSASLVGSEMCIRDSPKTYKPVTGMAAEQCLLAIPAISQLALTIRRLSCLLYTSDAADDM